MNRYIIGYYCREEGSLQTLNKASNREIIRALRKEYPKALTAQQIAEKTNRPENTVYAQLNELYDAGFIEILDKERKRGRPSAHENHSRADKYVIENLPRNLWLRTPIDYEPAAGVVDYPDGFLDAYHEVVDDKEIEELLIPIVGFLSKVYGRTVEGKKPIVKKWAPGVDDNQLCLKCGMNHEARDFLQAVLLHSLDHIYDNSKFIEFLKTSGIVNADCYDKLKTEIKEDEGGEDEDNF